MLTALKRAFEGSLDLEQIYADVRALRKHTPDLAYLQQFEWQLLFVYDELQKGHRKHDEFIKDFARPGNLGTAFTKRPFSVWKKRLGQASYPIALEARECDLGHGWVENEFNPKAVIEGDLSLQNRAAAARVRGELYAIPPIHFLALDRLKANRVLFERKRVSLILPHKEVVWTRERPEGAQKCLITTPVKFAFPRAWMYVGVEEHWRQELDFNFSPVRTVIPTLRELGRYYNFSQLEYDDV